jgi:ribosomal protein L7/L12
MIKIECEVSDLAELLRGSKVVENNDPVVYGSQDARIQDVKDLIAAVQAGTSRKIQAIKAARTLTGLSLKEAKDLVEEFMR